MARKRSSPTDTAEHDMVDDTPAFGEAASTEAEPGAPTQVDRAVLTEALASPVEGSLEGGPIHPAGSTECVDPARVADKGGSDVQPLPLTATSTAALVSGGPAELPDHRAAPVDDAKGATMANDNAAETVAQPSPHSASFGLVAKVIPIDAGPYVMSGADRSSLAQALIQTHAMVSAGAGFLPGIGIDVAAMSASQLLLLRRLSTLYGVEFREDLGRSIVAALLAGLVPFHLVTPVAGVLKSIPLVGQILGGLSMAVVGGIVTHTLGRAYIQHFESGGTLLTFDPQRVRAHFAAEHRPRSPESAEQAR